MRLVAIALGIVVVASTARAEPEPLPPLISWRAPLDCGDESALRQEIAKRAGRTRSDGGEPYAVAEVSADDRGVVGKLVIKSGKSLDVREVRGATCEQVADAVAWVLALTWVPPQPVAPPAVPAIVARHVTLVPSLPS